MVRTKSKIDSEFEQSASRVKQLYGEVAEYKKPIEEHIGDLDKLHTNIVKREVLC